MTQSELDKLVEEIQRSHRETQALTQQRPTGKDSQERYEKAVGTMNARRAVEDEPLVVLSDDDFAALHEAAFECDRNVRRQRAE